MRNRSLDEFLGDGERDGSAGSDAGDPGGDAATDGDPPADPDDGSTAENDATADDDRGADDAGGADPELGEAESDRGSLDVQAAAEPAEPTFAWAPDGACADCGESAPRRFRDGGRLVCSRCKDW